MEDWLEFYKVANRRYAEFILSDLKSTSQLSPEEIGRLENEFPNFSLILTYLTEVNDIILFSEIVRAFYSETGYCFLLIRGYWKELKLWLEKAIEHFVDIGDRRSEADFGIRLGGLYSNLGLLKQAEKALTTALSIFEEEKYLKGQVRAKQNLGIVYQLQGKNEIAKELFQRTLSLAESIDDQKSISSACHQLGLICQQEDHPEDAKKWYERSLEINQKINDKLAMAGNLHNLGLLAERARNFSLAKQLISSSLEVSELWGDKLAISNSRFQMSVHYEHDGDYSQALKEINSSLEIMRSLGDKTGEAHALYRMAQIYRHINDYESAYRKFANCLELQLELRNISGIAACSYDLGMIAKYEFKDYRKAKCYFMQSLKASRNPKHNLNLGLVYMQLADIAKEEGYLKKAHYYYSLQDKVYRLAGMPNTLIAVQNLIDIEGRTENYVILEKEYKNRIEKATMESQDVEVLQLTLELAILYERMGKRIEALELIETTLDKSDDATINDIFNDVHTILLRNDTRE